uniref:Annexin n=1 Tax=Schistosoma japonicum TaxID=6182 RepID=Q5DFR2_SCHJA|nr:SJCHGC06760 protein [Schistosoma japonicum]
MAKVSGFGITRSLIHAFDPHGKQYKPTIKPTTGFSASADAERLHRAMKGPGTDETTIINILARRTNYERQEIRHSYKSMYKRDLKDDLKSDTSGDFRKVLCQLVVDTPYMLAKSLYYAMKGLGTNDRVLIEILTTLWNDEMRAVANAYKEVLKDKGIEDSNRSLVTDMKKETCGDYEYALLSLVQAERDDIQLLQLKAIPEKGVNSVINHELAEADAKDLYASGAGCLGTREKRITRVICNRTPYQLYLTSEIYLKLYGKSLLEHIESETSGDYRKLLVSVLRYAIDRANLIAEWLHDSMVGLGTKDYALMRLLITRSEIDLQDIMKAYEVIYGKSLLNAVKDDTSGDYRQTLCVLLGE